MPRRSRSVRRRSAAITDSLTENRIEWLLHGYNLLDGDEPRWTDDDQARRVWLTHRETLLKWWRDGVPASYAGAFHRWGAEGVPYAEERWGDGKK